MFFKDCDFLNSGETIIYRERLNRESDFQEMTYSEKYNNYYWNVV